MQLTPGLKANVSRLKKALPKLRDEDRRKVDYIIQQTEPRREREEADIYFLVATGIKIIKPYEKEVPNAWS